MIIYNIRNNGPYEYDKWILNTFQLLNKVREEKIKYAGSLLHQQFEYLNTIIKSNADESSLCNKLNLYLIAGGK